MAGVVQLADINAAQHLSDRFRQRQGTVPDPFVGITVERKAAVQEIESGRRSGFEMRDRPPHELIEQWNGEGHLAV